MVQNIPMINAQENRSGFYYYDSLKFVKNLGQPILTQSQERSFETDEKKDKRLKET